MHQHSLRISMLFSLMVLPLLTGCAAIHPIKGIPVSQVPEEYLSMTRSDKHTISHSLLTQPVPPEHIIGRGDVLGIYIEGVLGNPGESPPVNFPTTADGNPTIGFPLQVRDDGTISMPLYGSVNVKGMTLRQLEEHLRDFYTNKGILTKGREKIIVTLQKARTVRVLVLRQEAQNNGGANQLQQQGGFNLGQLKQGSGKTVYLPAYQNDVLHALAETGGLPGLDAENAVYIIRNTQNNFTPDLQPEQINYGNQPQPGMPGIQGSPYMLPNGGIPYGQPQYNIPQQYSVPQQNPHQAYPQNMPVNTLPGYGLKSPLNKKHVFAGLEVVNDHSSKSQTPWKLLTVNAPVEYVQARGWNQQNNAPTNWEQSIHQTSYNSTNPYYNAAQQRGVIPEAVAPVVPPNLPAPVFQQRGSDMGATLQQLDKIDKMPLDLSKDPYYNIDRSSSNTMPPPKYDTAPVQYDLNQFTPIMQRPQAAPAQDFTPAQQQPQMGQAYQPAPQLMPNSQFIPQASQSFSPIPMQNPQPQQTQSPEAEPMQEGHQIETINPYDLPPNVIRIPIRLYPGEQINIKPADVVLNDGDIVFIESRQTEIYYTAGLLGGGQYTLPRDYDLDVLGAISIAQSAQNQTGGNTRAIGGVSAINGDVTISASNVIILRKTPDGGQIPIKIDLYKAIKDPNERILIMPEDVVMLRYKCGEGVGAFIERNLLEGALFGVAAAQLQTGGGGN
jgi:protein involved in polysaccharide export with SLBB domain